MARGAFPVWNRKALICVKVDKSDRATFFEVSRHVGDRLGMSKDRNLVLVVDDDPGMLRSVQRLLRQHAYEPIVFSSAQAFKGHSDFDKVVCIILDINLKD